MVGFDGLLHSLLRCFSLVEMFSLENDQSCDWTGFCPNVIMIIFIREQMRGQNCIFDEKLLYGLVIKCNVECVYW